MVVTGERVILLDTQPILSGAMLDQLAQSDQIPSNISPETYLDVLVSSTTHLHDIINTHIPHLRYVVCGYTNYMYM